MLSLAQFFESSTDVLVRQNVSRRYSYPLRAGHKSAFLCTESTNYRYVEDLETPKLWFASNVKQILELYGKEHRLQREDIFLGKLEMRCSMFNPHIKFFSCRDSRRT